MGAQPGCIWPKIYSALSRLSEPGMVTSDPGPPPRERHPNPPDALGETLSFNFVQRHKNVLIWEHMNSFRASLFFMHEIGLANDVHLPSGRKRTFGKSLYMLKRGRPIGR